MIIVRRIIRAILRKATKWHLRMYITGNYNSMVRAVFLGDFVSTCITLDGIYEGRELDTLSRFIFSRLPRNSVALDIGANIGNHSVFFSRHFDRVVAFEPNPMVAAVLYSNTIGLRRTIDVVPLGLSDAPGKVFLEICEKNLGGSWIRDTPSDNTIEIEVKTLDSIVQELALDKVSFIKIDVEGYEDKVIAGAEKLLRSSRPIIVFEGIYTADPEKGKAVSALLSDLGYNNFFSFSEEPMEKGVSQALYKLTPKFLKRKRPLRLQRIETLTRLDHHLAVASPNNVC